MTLPNPPQPYRPPHVMRRAILSAATVLMLCAAPAWAAPDPLPEKPPWGVNLINQIRDPWFWFGVSAQGLFFFRFFWQWIVSERHKRSVIPVSFWYFSMAGSMATFVYACKREDLVFMLAQALAFLIYVRNLVLIHNHAQRRRRAGLPPATATSTDDLEDDPA
jgi:lipid-A-disaccharide synthase-like uncharacterized protein